MSAKDFFKVLQSHTLASRPFEAGECFFILSNNTSLENPEICVLKSRILHVLYNEILPKIIILDFQEHAINKVPQYPTATSGQNRSYRWQLSHLSENSGPSPRLTHLARGGPSYLPDPNFPSIIAELKPDFNVASLRFRNT
jgi:hypothetical protein